jgi:hypothetical protein
MRDIRIELTPQELDFVGTVLSNVSFGTVANANMTHLLAKLREQANSPKLNGSQPIDPEEVLSTPN